MLTLEIAQNTFVFMDLPYPFSNVVLLRFKRTPFRLQKDSFCNAKRTLLKGKRTPFRKPSFDGQKNNGAVASSATTPSLYSCHLFCFSNRTYKSNYFDRNLSIWAAICFPLAIARTTSEAPLAASPATNTLGANLGCSGLRNPIASNTISHLMISGLPTGSISGRPPSGLGFHVISCTRTPVSLPFLSPRNSNELMFHRRVHPFSCDDVVLSVRGQFGHGFFGSSCPSTGRGIISIYVTDLHP